MTVRFISWTQEVITNIQMIVFVEIHALNPVYIFNTIYWKNNYVNQKFKIKVCTNKNCVRYLISFWACLRGKCGAKESLIMFGPFILNMGHAIAPKSSTCRMKVRTWSLQVHEISMQSIFWCWINYYTLDTKYIIIFIYLLNNILL